MGLVKTRRLAAMQKQQRAKAEIVDWGYPTVDDLLAAWDNVTFENVDEFR